MQTYCFDNMTGTDFELYLKALFEQLGYTVSLTPTTNDYGADLILEKGSLKKVVQAKCYTDQVGIAAVQEIIGAKSFYEANSGMVVTNSCFTPNATTLADSADIELWDRDKLIHAAVNSFNPYQYINDYQPVRQLLFFSDILNSEQFSNCPIDNGFLFVGKDSQQNLLMKSLDQIHHLLILGATNSGKSNLMHCMTLGLILKNYCKNLTLLLIDPKGLEMKVYNGMPNLLIPVVTDPRKASGALAWAVSEMLSRYKLFAQKNVRNISEYNKLSNNIPELNPLSRIVIMIDDLLDIYQINSESCSDLLSSILSRGSKTGINLIVTTQYSEIDKSIKNSFPSVAQLCPLDGQFKISMTMPFSSQVLESVIPYVRQEEAQVICKHLKSRLCGQDCEYDIEIMQELERMARSGKNINSDFNSAGEYTDELLPQAIECVIDTGIASTTLLQRRLRLSYARAARIMDELEQKGIIGPFEGSLPRQVLMTKPQWLEQCSKM